MKSVIKLPKKTKKTSPALYEKFSKSKRVVVFSPHLDDAIVSMGSVLDLFEQLDANVTIISIFTHGSDVTHPLSERLIKQGGHTSSPEYFKKRRTEDKEVFSKMKNVEIVHLGFVDAVWRTNGQGEPFYTEHSVGEIHPKDTQMHEKVADAIRELHIPTHEVLVFSPLAQGRHIDHQIVRNTVTDLFSNVMYYSDFPYSELYGHEHEFIEKHELAPHVWEQGSYEKKRDLILGYESQLVSLFKRGDVQLVHETFYLKKEK